MEVFIAFSQAWPVDTLARTMEAWDRIDTAEVVALKVDKPTTYQLVRRVSAENIAKSNYVLADYGCIPATEQFIAKAESYLRKYPKLGMIVSPGDGVCVCRKGIVDKWPVRETANYVEEHKQAFERRGYLVVTKRDMKYKRIDERPN